MPGWRSTNCARRKPSFPNFSNRYNPMSSATLAHDNIPTGNSSGSLHLQNSRPHSDSSEGSRARVVHRRAEGERGATNEAHDLEVLNDGGKQLSEVRRGASAIAVSE